MTLEDFLVDQYQMPVGYIGKKCIYCAEMIWHHDGSEYEAHAEKHVERGDVERIGVDEDGETLYRPVMGKPPLRDAPALEDR